MAHATKERSAIWRSLKDAGWAPPKPFVQMPLAELQEELERFQEEHGPIELQTPDPEPSQTQPAPAYEPDRAPDWVDPTFEAVDPGEDFASAVQQNIPYSNQRDPDEFPGQRVNSKDPDDVIRIDDLGRQWLQEEVRKPASPQPRGRRVLRYTETGTVTETVQVGEYTETFEVAGTGPGKPAEIKITLPSYQVGIYRDPRFPFKVICYGGTEGFDRLDVEEYYGGAELVPPLAKRIYVANVLCYDMRSVILAIQDEYRQQQLAGRIR